MDSPLLQQILPWAALGVAILAAAMMQFVSSAHKARALRAELQLADLEQQLQSLSEQFMAFERRSERTAWEIERLRDERQVEAPAPLVSESSGNYQHAIRLAMRGEGAQSLMEICSISRGEAELLVKLHQRSATPA
ncbi:MAG: DUF2802 domain-containing protein [Granulosicoccaceae bacterium]